MSERLFDPGPRAESTLTERQRLVLGLVRETPGGVPDAEVGRALHRRAQALSPGRRSCSCCDPEGEPCGFADESGRDVLARLRELGYGLVRRRTGRWEVPGTTPPVAPPTFDPAHGEIPF